MTSEAQPIIFDANVWIAWFDKSDSLHAQAVETLQEAEGPIYIPEYVVMEAVSVLLQNMDHTTASRFIDVMFHNEDIEILFADNDFFLSALEWFAEGRHSELSFTDCSLAVLSAEYEVVTFDEDLQAVIKNQA